VTPAEPAGPDPAFTAALETSVCSASTRFDHPPIGADAPFEGSEPGWCASEYAPLALYSTSELLAKVGVTAEDASSIRYVTFADDLDSCGYNRLEASAIQHLITIENVAKHGGKQGSAGAGQNPNNKVDRLLKWLAKVPEEQLVIYVDASSAAFVRDGSLALRAYAEILGAEQASIEDPERPCKELSSRVVLGAEASSNGLGWADDAFVPSWPAGEKVTLESTPPSPTRFRFLSSGTIMGPAGEIAALLTAAKTEFGNKNAWRRGLKWSGADDQVLLAAYSATLWKDQMITKRFGQRTPVAELKLLKAQNEGAGEGAVAVAALRGGGSEWTRSNPLPPVLDVCQKLFAVVTQADRVEVKPILGKQQRGRGGRVTQVVTGTFPAVLQVPGHQCGHSTGGGDSEECLFEQLGDLELPSCATDSAQGLNGGYGNTNFP